MYQLHIIRYGTIITCAHYDTTGTQPAPGTWEGERRRYANLSEITLPKGTMVSGMTEPAGSRKSTERCDVTAEARRGWSYKQATA